MPNQELRICVIGLGYVGLPLAVEFAKKGVAVYGFDISGQRVDELKVGHDSSDEMTDADLAAVQGKIEYSGDPAIIKKANFLVVAVPTPIDQAKKPDLSLVESASKLVGENIQPGSVVVYESTVYPGVTEDICGPIIEKCSGLKCGVDFKLGYSPERMNPGDKEHS
ncbi:MAG: NAD(P)-binding domain-containing protein, partial [Patescibacteria group bacterium]